MDAKEAAEKILGALTLARKEDRAKMRGAANGGTLEEEMYYKGRMGAGLRGMTFALAVIREIEGR